jgi:hypothetical protein
VYKLLYTHTTRESKGFFSTGFLPVGICTFGQTMVQSQEMTTECGSKGLMSDERPNDGSKAAKRSFKSHTIGFPPIKQPLALEAEPFASGCPRKMGQKKETFSCPTYMLSGIARGAVRSPTVESLEHGLSLAGHSRNEGLRRCRRRVQAAVEGVASERALCHFRVARNGPGSMPNTEITSHKPTFGYLSDLGEPRACE